jgi:hypothetical protein
MDMEKQIKLLAELCRAWKPARLSRWVPPEGRRGNQKKKYHPANEVALSNLDAPKNWNETVRAHVTGQPIALSCCDGGGSGLFVCLDIDDKDHKANPGESLEDRFTRVLNVTGMLVHTIEILMGLTCLVEVSSSGRGTHIWVFVDRPMPHDWLTRQGEAILNRATAFFRGASDPRGSHGANAFKNSSQGGLYQTVLSGDGRDTPDRVHNIEVYPKGATRLIALPLGREPNGRMNSRFIKLTETGGYEEIELEDIPTNKVPKRSNNTANSGPAPDWEAAFDAFLIGHAAGKGPLDGYEPWQHAIMILVATFKGTEQAGWAKERMMAACRAASGWDAREFEKKWQDAERTTRRITAGSFWHYAKTGGYPGPWPGNREVRDISYPEPEIDCLNPTFEIAKAMGERGYSTDEIRHELNRRYDRWDEAILEQVTISGVPTLLNFDEHVAPMNREWAQIITTGTEYLHIPSGESRAEKAFRDELAHLKLPPPSRGRPLRLEEQWREDPHRHKYSGLTAADPSTYRGPAFNVIRPLRIQPREDDVSIALEHIDHLTGSSGDAARDTLLDFSADIVQRPGATDCQIAIVLAGGAGTGKGTYGQLMQMILGERFMSLTSGGLMSRFNRDLFGKSLVFGDEISFPGNRETLEQMKSWVSENQRNYEQKYLPSFTGPNVTRFVLATNNIHAIHLDPDDRRYLLIDASGKQPESYWRRLHEWLREPQSAPAWLHYMLSRDVDRSRITGHAPMTPLKRGIIGMSNPLTSVMIEIASNGVCLFDAAGKGALASNSIVDLLKARGERHMTAEKVKAEIDRHWPEIAAGYCRSRKIPYAQRYRTVNRELPSGDRTDMELPMFKQNAVWGYFMPPLPEFREMVGQRHGVVIEHCGEPWAVWEPDQAEPDDSGPVIAPG